RDRVQPARPRPLPRAGDPLARLSDRSESGDDRGHRGHRLESARRHALRCPRPPRPLCELAMSTPRAADAPLSIGSTTLRAPLGAWAVLARFCHKKPLGAAGGAVMLVIVFTAIFANQLSTYDPIATDAAQSLAAPGREHWLGSDHLGRDIYSRIVHGARVSLVVSLASTLLGSVLGGVIGLLSGYIGGKTDLATPRVMDILLGLPLLVLALVMSAALGPSIENVVFAISIP